MNLMEYLQSIRADIGDYNVEEDHRRKMVIVRSTNALTNEQKDEVWNRVVDLGIQYVVTGPKRNT